jgi:hypothetical protein
LSTERNNRAELFATTPTAVHVVPPSIEYCHVPVLLTTPVTAIPLRDPESTSDFRPASYVETRSPLFVV